MVGDDRQRLERGLGQAPLLHRVALEQIGEILGGAERPLAGDAHEVDAAAGVEGAQLLEQAGDVLGLGEMALELGLVERLGGGEQQRLEDAQLLAMIGEGQRRDVARQRAGARRLIARVVAARCRCTSWLDGTRLRRGGSMRFSLVIGFSDAHGLLH